ncbi:MAG: 1,4-dihydroxy-6-naphthoate synthase [Bacteroidales bacterium]|jgi:1,4-dihydroxy-6-naphthoate synthase
MKLSLGFSPCPNDTFIFDAMVHGRIDTEGLEFDYFLADVEELNRRAFKGEVQITKMSYHAYAYAAQNYLILDSGSALGRKNGPLLISKKDIGAGDLESSRIAIPGKYTTANLLFSIAWPRANNKTEYLFSDIEDALLNDEVDAGLIIHETRFTYQKRGLKKIADMGEYWEKLTGLPIPLGTIVINRSVPEDVALKVNRILKRSLDYAYRDSVASFEFVAGNAREMDRDVMNNHIKLFVNEFTSELGQEGRRAIIKLYEIAQEEKVIPEMPERIFLTS